MHYVITQHRTSCALSNFPDEHKPDYIAEVIQLTEMEFADFKQDLGNLLMLKR